MNHSIASADRNTHFKIVVLALVVGIAVAVVGVSANITDNGTTMSRTASEGPAIKPSNVTQFTTRTGIEIR